MVADNVKYQMGGSFIFGDNLRSIYLYEKNSAIMGFVNTFLNALICVNKS